MYRVAAVALFVLAFALKAFGQVPPNQPASFPAGPNPHAVTTFHSIGLYWHVPGGSGSAQVEYKEASSSTWLAGHELYFDARNNEYRGSIVEVKPGTLYDIRLTAGSQVTLQATTWSETFPVPPNFTVSIAAGVKQVQIFSSNVPAPTTTVTGTSQVIRVPMAATAQTYTLVTAPAGQVLDYAGSTGNAGACIAVLGGTRYLILRGIKMVNCQLSAVYLARFSTPTRSTSDIIIEDNDISEFGPAPNSQTFAGVDCSFWHETDDTLRPTRIVIQRNRIHDPKSGSTNWTNDPSHPRGSNGLYFNHCGTNHVVRYNEFYATEPNARHFMDGIGGAENASRESDGYVPFHYGKGTGTEGFGFPWADSDIYGNRISHAYDDAIEAEGANRNVRIWGNYMDKVGIGIANATTGMGPLYVWRNVSNLLANMKCPAPCDPDNTEDRGPFIKAGKTEVSAGIPSLNGGRSYYYHNTVLQPDIGTSFPGGAGYGIGRAGGNLYNIVSRNNIWHIHKPVPGPGNDFWSILSDCNLGPCSAEYDIYNGRVELVQGSPAPEPNGFSGTPTYSSRFQLPSDNNGWTGNFELEAATLGYRTGASIPNFSRYASPDVGAHQSGTAPMLFGVRACYPSGGAANLSCQQP